MQNQAAPSAPSPEGQPFSAWRCAGCGNRNEWIGYDDEGYGGPSECECTAGETDDAACTCTTTLRQHFSFPPLSEAQNPMPHAAYDAHTGGGDDAEIGDYTRIQCAECGAWLWCDPEYVEAAAAQDGTA